MAKPSPKQQSSQLKKLLLVGGGLVAIIIVAFPSGNKPAATGAKKPPVFGAPSSGKKTDDIIKPEDTTAKFAPIGATIKNGFVPLVVKGEGKAGGGLKSPIPSNFTDGGTWIYTGNMSVDGVPNALLENSANGEGVFLRPGQHWKNLRLVSVKEDSIEVEGPAHEMKTVYFDDKGLSGTSSVGGTLPPAAIQGNLPQGMNPQAGQPGARRQRFGQQANQGADMSMTGQIGNGNDYQTSYTGQDQGNGQANGGRKNRRIRGNQ